MAEFLFDEVLGSISINCGPAVSEVIGGWYDFNH
jgi:hypothetical protein